MTVVDSFDSGEARAGHEVRLIDLANGSALFGDPDYKCLAQAVLSETLRISLIRHRPQLRRQRRADHLETMVFDDGEVVDNGTYRYATEKAAYAAHDEMVLLMHSELDWRSA